MKSATKWFALVGCGMVSASLGTPAIRSSANSVTASWEGIAVEMNGCPDDQMFASRDWDLNISGTFPGTIIEGEYDNPDRRGGPPLRVYGIYFQKVDSVFSYQFCGADPTFDIEEVFSFYEYWWIVAPVGASPPEYFCTTFPGDSQKPPYTDRFELSPMLSYEAFASKVGNGHILPLNEETEDLFTAVLAPFYHVPEVPADAAKPRASWETPVWRRNPQTNEPEYIPIYLPQNSGDPSFPHSGSAPNSPDPPPGFNDEPIGEDGAFGGHGIAGDSHFLNGTAICCEVPPLIQGIGYQP